MNRELQYDREVELQQQENYIENKNELLNKMEFLLKEKYRNSPLILKVYIDREKDKYYIDTFAAYSLGFISYQKAASDSDSGRKLFEISKATLEMLERVFKGRILYQYLSSKVDDSSNSFGPDNFPNNYEDVLNKYDKYINKNRMDTSIVGDSFIKNAEMKKLFDSEHNDLVSFDKYEDNFIK